MKNYQITGADGNQYWVHRAVAVTGIIFSSDAHNLYVLAAKRGTGAADHHGLWNCPCGYLDFDESAEEAVIREVKEETNLTLELDDLVFHQTASDPKMFKQNVSLRFLAFVPSEHMSQISIGTGGEVDEVAEVKWIPLEEVGNYEWAYEHDVLVRVAGLEVIQAMIG